MKYVVFITLFITLHVLTYILFITNINKIQNIFDKKS